MKYKFFVEFDAPEGILESQVGVPIMNALKIDRVKVEAAKQNVQADGGEVLPAHKHLYIDGHCACGRSINRRRRS